jgi:hypothetical protein
MLLCDVKERAKLDIGPLERLPRLLLNRFVVLLALPAPLVPGMPAALAERCLERHSDMHPVFPVIGRHALKRLLSSLQIFRLCAALPWCVVLLWLLWLPRLLW